MFGACMSGLALASLLTPGGPLEPIWQINPQARQAFSTLGTWAVLLMAVVCGACCLAAVGLLKRSAWGYWLAIGILAVNLAGDVLNTILNDDLRTLIGLPIGALLIAFLTRPSVRDLFGR